MDIQTVWAKGMYLVIPYNSTDASAALGQNEVAIDETSAVAVRAANTTKPEPMEWSRTLVRGGKQVSNLLSQMLQQPFADARSGSCRCWA